MKNILGNEERISEQDKEKKIHRIFNNNKHQTNYAPYTILFYSHFHQCLPVLNTSRYDSMSFKRIVVPRMAIPRKVKPAYHRGTDL